MNRALFQVQEKSLLDDPRTYKKLEFNFKKNREQDQGPELDRLGAAFRLEDCEREMWNPEKFSLMYKTPLWEQATPDQRVKLNQLYWVAYYSQIISAEIATIFFNQTSAAALYGVEDFRLVCDTLDLESMQERAHIDVFKKVSEEFEQKIFGERVFTYPMRTPYTETMVHHNTNRLREFWKRLQLQAFTVLSSGNAFLGCQYFTVRGLRTLNGKLIQHQLSGFYSKHPDQARAPIPSKISYCHFLDESYHFNSSMIIGLEVVNSLREPTPFEKRVANLMLTGCQRDHFTFSTAINGIFWYDPALYPKIYRILRSPIFGLDHGGALEMMEKCFARETDGAHLSAESQRLAVQSYKEFLARLNYVNGVNKDMRIMGQNSLARHLAVNAREFARFKRQARDLLPPPGPQLRKAA